VSRNQCPLVAPPPRAATRALFPAVLGLYLGLLGGCGGQNPAALDPPLVVERHTTMGSPLEISVAGPDDASTRSAIQDAFREVDRLDELMSIWKPGSDILRLNAAAGNHAVALDQQVLDVLRLAVQAGDWTNGKFDVTFGVLSGLWKFDAQNQDDRIPDRSEVVKRLALLDYTRLTLDHAAGTAFLRDKGMSVNLGGIGKGYAVDRAAGILRGAGLRNFMVQFGGDLLVSGFRDGRPWTLGIRDPRGPEEQVFASVALSDSTFSTSGDYERFFLAGGRRYHHIIDPDSGEPARGSRSVTIVAKQGAIADALSTGVFILGPAAGMALVERLPDVEAVIVSDDNEILVSSGLKDRLTILMQPTDAP
jgi:thiamine biosynthesis lipoprotein